MSQIIKNIYLAGKITGNFWRSDLTNVYRDSNLSGWPIIPNAIFGKYNYTGPYFREQDVGHYTYQGDNQHGAASWDVTEEDFGGHGVLEVATINSTHQHKIFSLCMAAIDRSDTVFAWLDGTDAYGTLVEIGYAYAKNKTIYIGISLEFNTEDFWFVLAMANKYITAESAVEAFSELVCNKDLSSVITSPIEKAFWEEWVKHNYPALEPQYEILHGRYRLDFAHLSTKTAIELDGLEAHSSTASIANDRRRQREIEAEGWRFIRFGGKEIYHNVQQCVKEAHAFIERCSEDSRDAVLKRIFSQTITDKLGTFKPGDKVVHRTMNWGQGMVIKSDSREVTVAFAGNGIKKVVAAFLQHL